MMAALGLIRSPWAVLLLVLKATVHRLELYMAPEKDKAPPLWIRAILVLTCTGDLSRNRTLGLKIGREGGFKPAPANEQSGPVAEGIVNARSIKLLAQRVGVEMPIVDAVYSALYEAEPPKAMVDKLLSRTLKAEF